MAPFFPTVAWVRRKSSKAFGIVDDELAHFARGRSTIPQVSSTLIFEKRAAESLEERERSTTTLLITAMSTRWPPRLVAYVVILLLTELTNLLKEL